MIDSHAHLYMCNDSLKNLIDSAKKAGVSHIVNVAINLETAAQVLEDSRQHPELIPTIGLYPGEPYSESMLTTLKSDAKQHPYKAIGEIGLDYFKMNASKSEQLALFEAQLSIADELNLPVIIHNRHSEDDVAAVVANFPHVKKVFHCYWFLLKDISIYIIVL